jgi:hypothetical protein
VDGKFVSQAQWRWAFATNQPWARKWAHRNQRSRPFRSLPKNRPGNATSARVRSILTGGGSA